MRAILWGALALLVLWGGYWVVGSRAIAAGVTDWFAHAGDQGITATQNGISVSGFANRFDLTVTDPHLADPATGWGWQAPFAQVFAMTWKPWHLIAALPNDQTITAPGQQIDLASSKMEGSFRVAPTTDATLAEIVVEGHDIVVKSDKGWQVAAKSLVAAVAPDPTVANSQRLGLDVVDLAPGASLTALVPELGPSLSLVHLDTTVTLTAPIDRHVAETKPRVTAIRLTDFHMTWGDLGVTAKGQVAPDASGVADGKISVAITHWQTIPDLLVALGLVQPGMGKSITTGLTVLAKAGGKPDELDLDLVFADGQMRFGPLPLGPAPQLN